MNRTRPEVADGSPRAQLLLALRCWSYVLAFAAPATAQTCTIERLSVDVNGLEGDAASTQPGITPDGRFVVFTSSATNLVPGDTNAVADIFVRDLVLGTIERVSVGAGGVECDQGCSYPVISDDGRYVAFSTAASTLVAGDTNGALDVYVRDRASDTIERVSIAVSGVQGDGPSFGAAFAACARYVTFVSWASNLVPGDTNGTRDVFLCDRAAGTIERVSISTSGAQGDDLSGSGSLLSFTTPDGRYVSFGSMASTLVAGDTAQTMDMYVRDRVAATTTLLAPGLGGGFPAGDSDLYSMSPDGRYVGFTSAATDLVAGDTNGTTDAFVLDRSTGIIERISLQTGGAESAGDSWTPVVSHDGRYVLYSSAAADMVANDTNGTRDIFRRDRATGLTERVLPPGGLWQLAYDMYTAGMSANGSRIVVAYAGDDLVGLDQNTVSDVFVGTCVVGLTFCSGDGTATACPCGVGSWNAGCPNSFGGSGLLEASGHALVSSDTLALYARHLPPNTTVQFYQGPSQQNGGNGSVVGDGLRCLGGSLVRLGTRYTSDGTSSWGAGAPGSPPLSIQGNVPSGGDIRLYQVFYRNPSPYCGLATFNTTNGLEVQWLP